ncbi:MAG: lipopolysaccharide kinase InaA family protein [Sulfurimonas sp.]|jgi:serine/threonine protein kinase|nr:lipopolysaccharide kinase InaA family protein [Sulfurimonas sp.]
MKYKLNSKYQNLYNFLIDIRILFAKNNNTIHKARNELKIIQYDKLETVVKAFKIPNFINQFVYSYIRDSKAKKSYFNAIKLEKLGINTPEPIAYIEFFKFCLLKESFFVTKKLDYQFSIREPLRDKHFQQREQILKSFVSFTYDLHCKNVYHKDYSPGNILVIKKDDKFEFSIVDINRMEFRTVDAELGLNNFSKLWLDKDTLVFIAKEYAKLASVNELQAIEILQKSDKKLKDFVKMKRKIRARD